MSADVLKSLMQLFAIIGKQNNGPTVEEGNFVLSFLSSQLDSSSVDKHFSLFSELSSKKNTEKRTSVIDSVSIIGIAKKINKILTQKQKVFVVIKILELIRVESSGYDTKVEIAKTLADVFNITAFDFNTLRLFVLSDGLNEIEKSELLTIEKDRKLLKPNEHLTHTNIFANKILLLRIKSVELYLFKVIGDIDVRWNGIRILNSAVHLFPIGGVLQLNNEKPIYYQEVVSGFNSAKEFFPLSFNVNNLRYTFPGNNVGLHEINISEQSGKLIGIMGASGSGKTTLLNIISGLQPPTSGNVVLNGINIHDESKKIIGAVGFVPQDDLLVEELTVFDNLFFNAKLCFALPDVITHVFSPVKLAGS